MFQAAIEREGCLVSFIRLMEVRRRVELRSPGRRLSQREPAEREFLRAVSRLGNIRQRRRARHRTTTKLIRIGSVLQVVAT